LNTEYKCCDNFGVQKREVSEVAAKKDISKRGKLNYNSASGIQYF